MQGVWFGVQRCLGFFFNLVYLFLFVIQGNFGGVSDRVQVFGVVVGVGR